MITAERLREFASNGPVVGQWWVDAQIAQHIPDGGLSMRQWLSLPILADDRLWVALRWGLIDAATLRLFAQRCVDRARTGACLANDRAMASPENATYKDLKDNATAAADWATVAASALDTRAASVASVHACVAADDASAVATFIADAAYAAAESAESRSVRRARQVWLSASTKLANLARISARVAALEIQVADLLELLP